MLIKLLKLRLFLNPVVSVRKAGNCVDLGLSLPLGDMAGAKLPLVLARFAFDAYDFSSRMECLMLLMVFDGSIKQIRCVRTIN